MSVLSCVENRKKMVFLHDQKVGLVKKEKNGKWKNLKIDRKKKKKNASPPPP
jgi:hypothetical protein